MLQEEKEKLSFEETPKIVIPSKYRCERHSHYSDEKPCKECMKVHYIKVSDIHNKPNVPMAVLVDENDVLQVVINTSNEFTLWAAYHRLENAIRFVLQQEEIKRQATAIQTAPASVLDQLRGSDA